MQRKFVINAFVPCLMYVALGGGFTARAGIPLFPWACSLVEAFGAFSRLPVSRGFTLTEVVAVAAIMAALASLEFTFTAPAREQAQHDRVAIKV